MKIIQALPTTVFVSLLLLAQPVQAQPMNNNYSSGGNYSSQAGSGPQTGLTQADPRSRAKVHTELAALYYQAGNLAVALDELKVAIDSDSGYAPAYSVKGLVHAGLRENDEAERAFRKALDLTPQDPEVNNNYGWFLCQTGKERQSIAYFLNALKSPLYSTPELAYANAGGCALKAGDMEGAEAYLQQAVRLARDGGLLPRQQLAAVYYKRGNLQEARSLISGVLKATDQPSAEALWLGLRIERKLGNSAAEGALAAQLRGRHPASKEYQDFLKGNFE